MRKKYRGLSRGWQETEVKRERNQKRGVYEGESGLSDDYFFIEISLIAPRLVRVRLAQIRMAALLG